MDGQATGLDSLLPDYPVEVTALFEDPRGREAIVIANDGHTLETSIRGVLLRGSSFDTLEAVTPGPDQPFEADESGWLRVGTFTISMSVPASIAGAPIRLPLTARVDLSRRRESVNLALELPDGRGPYADTGTGSDFEGELEHIVAQLPPDVRLQCCFTCGLSDYSPAGKGIFGDLGCFRDVAKAYRKVTSKWDMFALWPSLTESVQETHLCPHWEARPPGRGYRGWPGTSTHRQVTSRSSSPAEASIGTDSRELAGASRSVSLEPTP